MKCPHCGHEESKVTDSRPVDENSSIKRRRECLNCQARFTTYETIETIQTIVIKKDGSREYFNKSNSSILKAIERMNKEISCKCYMDGKLYIKPIGVKWLAQKYYRKSYIKELLNYKQKLNEKENKND